EQGESYWPHHLTMARLVARALRINRSALIQSGVSAGHYAHYRLSYLMPALLWPDAVMVIAPESIRNRLVMVEIPRLQHWMSANGMVAHKPIHIGDSSRGHQMDQWPHPNFKGLFITSPELWLSDRLYHHNRFPHAVPIIMDGVDDLEQWVQDQLTLSLSPQDWETLMLACPEHTETIRDIRVQLTRSIFQHPPNPHNRNLLDDTEQGRLRHLEQQLQPVPPLPQSSCSPPCQPSPQNSFPATSNADGESSSVPYIPAQWQRFFDKLYHHDQLMWASIHREQGHFSLHCTPLESGPLLDPLWNQQPFVLIGNALDSTAQATTYCQKMGLGDITCLKFAPDRHHDLIQLYLPDQFPLPNTPHFQSALLQKVRQLLCSSADAHGLTVILIGDTPLKSQLATTLASEFGSRLQVEQTCLEENGILVSGWDFWRNHHDVLPAPTLLVMSTLPIPSLEDPLVAGRVSRYKRRHQNWFTDYLLPETLKEVQRAIAPLRNSQGIIALLDNRVNHRSYGAQVLDAMSPFARINYIDEQLFKPSSRPVLDG
ncbi:MAG: ATP-dependent DNA helicase, partial [Symploca sp. SIO2B6]|nr:ATP-dependent DNA helicase [Symploca sp. SIO2B6]